MATIILDSKGWKVDGTYLGRWGRFSDIILAATEAIQNALNPFILLTGNGSQSTDSLIRLITTAIGTVEARLNGALVEAGARLNLGAGDDQIIIEATATSNPLTISLDYEGMLNTGNGNDTIKASSSFGIVNRSAAWIITGRGNDTIIGES